MKSNARTKLAKNEKKYLAIGNAKASSGSMSLTSERIEAFYNEEEDSAMDIKLVKAHRKVKITDKKLEIIGGHTAEYNLEKDYFAIFGKKLVLTSEKNKLKSNNISLNRKVLADLAMNNPNAFEAIVKSLK